MADINKNQFTVLFIAMSLIVCGFLSFPGETLAEDLQGVAAWKGEGMLLETGEKQVHFVGAFIGVMLVGNAHEFDAAKMVCPATIERNLETGLETGHGRCVLTDRDNNRIFAKWTCDGNPANCGGKFSFTGGTGKFKNISGDNEFLVQTDVLAFRTTGEDGLFQEAAGGKAIWPRITYALP